jgi:hypothetical protein
MELTYPGFGRIEVEGTRYEHDVVIDGGVVRPRDKGPSRARKAEFGHTPLTAAEDLPWGGERLVVGTGASGSLPVLPEIDTAARARGVELVAVPTAEACRLLAGVEPGRVHAVLHVTC